MNIFISILIVSLISLIGIFVISVKEKILKKILLFLISFAVGALFGDVFLHLMPGIYADNHEGDEMSEMGGVRCEVGDVIKSNTLHTTHRANQLENEHNHHHNTLPSLLIIFGILGFFMIEKFLHWRHCHHLPDEKDHAHPVAMINLIGDGLHNLMDGMLIATSYLLSPAVGISTTIAVCLHEIPQEIGDFATLTHAGYSRKKAIITNLISGLSAFVGAGVILFVNPDIFTLKNILIPITAGGFIYIAGSDLIPMLHEKNNFWSAFFQILGIVLGVFVMYLITFIE